MKPYARASAGAGTLRGLFSFGKQVVDHKPMLAASSTASS